MTRSWWLRFALLCFFIGTAVVHVIPTLSGMDLEKTWFPYKRKVNLGLDLQGGLYMVYGIDFNKVYRETAQRVAESYQAELQKNQISAQLSAPDLTVPEDPRITITFDGAQQAKAQELLDKQGWTIRKVSEGPGTFIVSMSREYSSQIRENTLNQSVQVIRNRIDEFGVTEPSISTKGADKVVVELPGVRDIQRAKDLVGRTARLEFKRVNQDVALDLPSLVIEAEAKGVKFKEGDRWSSYTAQLNEALKSKIPEGSQILFERPKNKPPIPFLLHGNVELTGAELVDAQVGLDPTTQEPHVGFSLNPRGTQTFAELTTRMRPIGNRHQLLAIVLDDVVYSAPRINEPITGGRGSITIGGMGEEAFKESRDLAIVLRAGALPAQLELQEQRVIGPSIGADSIRHGINAGLLGCLLVFVFVSFYYRWSGVVATISLILNGLFTLAVLIGLDATLTLPGIAGLALTIGMAVDSNVIIFERIRDELRDGRSIAAAVQAGFDKAFSCILDANITHGIVALVLLNFGTGPMRGFAIMLLIGIVTTIFCAVTVCKLYFDFWLARNHHKPTSISI
jgi:preprotein translocase subunit SecD